jgi:hypothetical protein
MNTEQHKYLQEAAAAAAAASRTPPSSKTAAGPGSASPATNPYAALAAAAAAAGAGGGSPYLRPAAGFPQLPTSAGLSDHSSWLMLCQNPLVQAALRQQQLHWISQIASMSTSPFMNPGMAGASAGAGLGPATGFPATSLPGLLPPLVPTNTTSSEILAAKEDSALPNMLPSSVASPTSSSLDTASMYREYLSKIAQLTTSSTTGIPTSPAMASILSAGVGVVAGETVAAAASQKVRTASQDSNGNSAKQSPMQMASTASNAAAASIVSKLFEQTSNNSNKTASKITSTSNNGPAQRKPANGGTTYNGRDKVFTCKTCNRSFGYKHVLQNHERTHTGEKPFECKVCKKRFTRDHHLKTHMRLHTGEKPYSCTHCDRQFVQVANLRRHLRVHTGERPYKCEVCLSCFSDSNQLKAHVLIHSGEKPFSCDKCGGKFRRRHHLVHHVCPMVPGSGNPQLAAAEGAPDEDPTDDERYIFAAKRARSTSHKEGMFEASAPAALLSQFSEGPQPSNLELLMLARARAAQESAALSQLTSQAALGVFSQTTSAPSSGRSRKSRDPKRLHQSPPKDVCKDELPHSPRPQSEPEDLSSSASASRVKDEDDIEDYLEEQTMMITTSEMNTPPPATTVTPTPTLNQMPIANKQ